MAERRAAHRQQDAKTTTTARASTAQRHYCALIFPYLLPLPHFVAFPKDATRISPGMKAVNREERRFGVPACVYKTVAHIIAFTLPALCHTARGSLPHGMRTLAVPSDSRAGCRHGAWHAGRYNMDSAYREACHRAIIYLSSPPPHAFPSSLPTFLLHHLLVRAPLRQTASCNNLALAQHHCLPTAPRVWRVRRWRGDVGGTLGQHIHERAVARKQYLNMYVCRRLLRFSPRRHAVIRDSTRAALA